MIKISLFQLITPSEYLPLSEQYTSNAKPHCFAKPDFILNMCGA